MNEHEIDAVLKSVLFFLRENGDAMKLAAQLKGCTVEDNVALILQDSLRYELTFGPLRIDPQRKVCYIHDEEVRLLPVTVTALVLLLERPGKPVHCERFCDLLWKGYGRKQQMQNLRTLMCRLRPKLRVAGVDIVHEGKSYRLVEV